MILGMTEEECVNALLNIFYRANTAMLGRDAEEIHNNVSERTICADLKTELDILLRQSVFRNYYVDVEYNRGARGYLKAIDDDGSIKAISCDLIIHSRGKLEHDNLLCLEMKKAKGSNKDSDRRRLKALTTPNGVFNAFGNVGNKALVSGYLIGIYYEYDKKTDSVYLEHYKQGQLVKHENIKIRTCG